MSLKGPKFLLAHKLHKASTRCYMHNIPSIPNSFTYSESHIKLLREGLIRSNTPLRAEGGGVGWGRNIYLILALLTLLTTKVSYIFGNMLLSFITLVYRRSLPCPLSPHTPLDPYIGGLKGGLTLSYTKKASYMVGRPWTLVIS